MTHRVDGHDVIEAGFDVRGFVRCACGCTFNAGTLERAREMHANHFGLETARAALREAGGRASHS